MAYNFQTGINKIKLFAEYESVTHKSFIRIIITNAKQFQHERFSWNLRCPRGVQFSFTTII
jgi:hypothetical protein